MKFLKSIHKFIPGFRQLSSNSMMIAATYYGAAILTAVKYWYWGLALLALPFLIFYLLDLNRTGRKRAPLVASVLAGLLILLGAGVGFSSGGFQDSIGTVLPTVSNALPAAQSAQGTKGLPSTPSIVVATAASVLLLPGATVSDATPYTSGKPGSYAYVSAKGSKVFHLAGCPSAKRIKPENLIGFATREQALAAGLQPCKKCKP